MVIQEKGKQKGKKKRVSLQIQGLMAKHGVRIPVGGGGAAGLRVLDDRNSLLWLVSQLIREPPSNQRPGRPP